MSLTLDPALAAAQDSQSRKPLVEIISGQLVADIPFDGQRLTAETTEEKSPNLIRHTSGRLALVYSYSTNVIKYVYTNEARTVFTPVSLAIDGGETLLETSLCELANGNIGIVYRTQAGTSQYLKRKIITITGTAVSSGTIATYTGSPIMSGPALLALANGTFLLAYIRLSAGEYKFYKRTSADFLTWSSASEISVAGIDQTTECGYPYLMQLTTGQILFFFDGCDGGEIFNIFYSVSSDNGGTWGGAVHLTSYTSIAEQGRHPWATQKMAGQMHVVFNSKRGALHIDETTEGWLGAGASGTNLSFDAASRKLYVTSSDDPTGTFNGIAEIDVDAWMVTNFWDASTTTPRFSAAIDTLWERFHGESYLIPVGSRGKNINGSAGEGCLISVLDADGNTITDYVFADWPAYSLVKNVTHSLEGLLQAAWIDFSTRRMYVLCSTNDGVHGDYVHFDVGWIDLTDPGPSYTCHTLIAPTHLWHPTLAGEMGLAVYPGQDLILIWNGYDGDPYKSALAVYSMSTGAIYKSYDVDSFPGFPYHGPHHAVLVGNKIYCTFGYEPLYGEVDKRGLCEIDISTDAIVFYRPDWASIDEYGLNMIEPLPDGRLLISTHGADVSGGAGVTIFDPLTQTWELFNNTTLPGFWPATTPAQNYSAVAYDPVTGLCFAGSPSKYGVSWGGLTAFSEFGLIQQASYMVGTFAAGVWTWGAMTDLVQGYLDYDAAVVFGPGASDGMYAFWTHMAGDDLSIKWDQEGTTLNLAPYLAKDRPIEAEWSIDGSPNSLSFTVSDGHLFDPHNKNSLLSPVLKKGRKLTLRFGENVGGTEYWKNQGTSIITPGKGKYARGKYPERLITAKDRRILWDQKKIIATAPFNTNPKSILTDILKDHLNLADADLDLPTFDTAVDLTHQWIDTLAKDIIEQICHRFGYFPHISVDGLVTARKISDSNEVDHIYANLTKEIEFSDDDEFSTFTNQVIVTGHERTEIEILYGEELLQTLAGTIGWWGCKQTYDINYSVDRSRRCRDPRLKILQSTSSIGFQLAGQIHESITLVDPNETYCVVTVTAPNLVPILIFAIPEWAAAHFIPDAVASLGAGWTVPVGRVIESVWMFVIMMIISAVGNFQYEIWGRPVGKIKRSVEGQDNDAEFQAEIGEPITTIIEDPLCYSGPECTQVAKQELLVARLERSRVTFSKIADLRDEVGDTIQVNHPHTQAPMKIFITDLKRRMVIPSAGQPGEFTDTISGWVL
jgi:hypothetical protein